MERAYEFVSELLNLFEDNECKSCVLEHTYILPSHPDLMCQDPESITGNYDDFLVSKWNFVQCLLKNYNKTIEKLNNDLLNINKTEWISSHIEQLIETIYSAKNSDSNDYYANKTDFESLKFVLQWLSIRHFDNIFKLFFTQTLPKCIQIALNMPLLFPVHSLKWEWKNNTNAVFHEQFITFSRMQCICLLTHMFFNTVCRVENIHTYWTNFDIYYQQTESNQCVFSYLLTLIHYFNHFVNKEYSQLEQKNDNVIFRRVSMCNYHVNLNENDSKDFVSNKTLKIDILNEDIVFMDYNKIDTQKNDIYIVDFANKYVGFGRSGTQEEVIFGSHCEACIVMLISPSPMQDNEVIVIENVQTIARFKNKGQTLQFDECIIDTNIKINIIASDASELDVIDNKENSECIVDLSEPYFSRDLLKAIVMFGCCYNEKPGKYGCDTIVRTGLWGCGAFMGNKYIKVLIQIIAAHHIEIDHLNGMQICCDDDYCKDNEFRKELLQFMKWYNDNNITVNMLLQCLMTNQNKFQTTCNVFLQIMNYYISDR